MSKCMFQDGEGEGLEGKQAWGGSWGSCSAQGIIPRGCEKGKYPIKMYKQVCCIYKG